MKRNYLVRKILPCLVLLTFILLFSACSKDKVTNPSDSNPTAGYDAAKTIAASLALTSGGATDQINDICQLATPGGLTGSRILVNGRYVSFSKTYDSVGGYWNIHFIRERGDSLALPYAYMERIYRLQYLNEDGLFQQHWVENADTARTINFTVLEGHGIHHNQRIYHELLSLTGQWTVTDAHLPIVTVNGTTSRAAVDTLTTPRKIRIMTHTLALQYTNVRGPRGHWNDLATRISGTITGTFDGHVTVISGDLYNERDIHRDIHIVLGSGTGTFGVDGKTYHADLETGVLQN